MSSSSIPDAVTLISHRFLFQALSEEDNVDLGSTPHSGAAHAGAGGSPVRAFRSRTVIASRGPRGGFLRVCVDAAAMGYARYAYGICAMLPRLV